MANVLLACGASAALHKACDLASRLAQDGHAVRAVLTPRAAELVSPQLFQALTGEPAASDEFGAGRRGGMDHVDLGAWAEVLVVAPASADLVTRLAHGIASDLPTTVALALAPERPRVLCPAMNPSMLAAPPVRRALELLAADGWRLVEPGEGRLACGVEGRGRLAEVDAIVAAVAEALG